MKSLSTPRQRNNWECRDTLLWKLQRKNTKGAWWVGERDLAIETNNSIKARRWKVIELFFCKKKYLLVGASGMLWAGELVSGSVDQ